MPDQAEEASPIPRDVQGPAGLLDNFGVGNLPQENVFLGQPVSCTARWSNLLAALSSVAILDVALPVRFLGDWATPKEPRQGISFSAQPGDLGYARPSSESRRRPDRKTA